MISKLKNAFQTTAGIIVVLYVVALCVSISAFILGACIWGMYKVWGVLIFIL